MSTKNKAEDSCHGCYDIHTWHRILGHCNYDDIKKLPNVVEGMKIKERYSKQKPVKSVSREIFLREEINNPTDVKHF